jgi:hypothetical protein
MGQANQALFANLSCGSLVSQGKCLQQWLDLECLLSRLWREASLRYDVQEGWSWWLEISCAVGWFIKIMVGPKNVHTFLSESSILGEPIMTIDIYWPSQYWPHKCPIVHIYIPLASKPYKFVGCKLKPWV